MSSKVAAPPSEEAGKIAASKRTSFFKTVGFALQGESTTTNEVGNGDLMDPLPPPTVDYAPNDLEPSVELAMPLSSVSSESSLPPITTTTSAPQVIDLASALGMAGGNAWTIQLARQRTVEAHANLRQAEALWLPSLQFGVGWNKHDGRLQETSGGVLEASRSSFFVGGGATVGVAPVAGGSNGPLRLSADLALADAYFAPKIARRQYSVSKAGVSIAMNQALLDAGLAYIDLLEATGQVSDSQTAILAATELKNLTQTFAEAGAGAQADVDRAATAEASLLQQLHNANRLQRVRSAALARRLRLDPQFSLQPADQVMIPIELSADASDVESLIASSLAQRPEVNALSHEISGLCLAVKKADVEPWIPQVAVTTSAGSFSGGRGSSLDNSGSRSDLDLQALWEIENLGFGVAAKRSRAGSQLAQRRIQLADLRDEITSQVVQAYEDVANYRMQIDASNLAMKLAEASYERNLQRVKADEGLPIELLQAINARAETLQMRTLAVSNYNRSQLRLLHATGGLRH
ncbi:MAG: TolC family protein [Rubripirellula sp.]